MTRCEKLRTIDDETKSYDMSEYQHEVVQELEEYKKIGTVEECMVAVEKQKNKKPYILQGFRGGNYMACPNCNSFIGLEIDCKRQHYKNNYCPCCGQKFDWESEGEECL